MHAIYRYVIDMSRTKTRKTIKSARDNKLILAVLETVKAHYSLLNDKIHVNAYSRAIHAIRKWPRAITAGKELAHLDGIGKGMIQKIDIILATGTLPIIQEKGLKINNSKTHTYTHTHKHAFINSPDDIRNVLGFGQKVANHFKTEYHVTTISDLRKLIKTNAQVKLTTIQRLGLQYHDDLRQKIPRGEITQVGKQIEKVLGSCTANTSKEGYGKCDDEGERDNSVMVFLAGSYPSGLKEESKDIDILLVSRKKENKLHLAELVKKLETKIPLETISLGANKFLGLVKLDQLDQLDQLDNRSNNKLKWRHLDMRLVDMSAFPFAWMYYASGVEFNKLIREKLKKRGYKLNEWGLYDQQKNNERVTLEDEKEKSLLDKEITTKEEMLEYATRVEKNIFKIANMEYQTIRERY
jgi:DNA polymerase/3'-5' exonuclease PolX